MRFYVLVIAVLAPILSACDPWFGVEVQVHDKDGHPKEGVGIMLECPDERRGLFKLERGPRRIGESDAQGQLHYEQALRADGVCWVFVEGHPKQRSSLVDKCAAGTSKYCPMFGASITLLAEDK